jgi:hypothetical protein
MLFDSKVLVATALQGAFATEARDTTQIWSTLMHTLLARSMYKPVEHKSI